MKNCINSGNYNQLPSSLQLFALFIASVFLFTNCKKEAKPDLIYLPYGNYLSAFNDEAKKHGMDFYDELLKIKFDTISGYSEGQNCGESRIMLPDWYIGLLSRTKELHTQQFIFHALGHCLLGREHDNSKLPNGEWKSIMRNEPFLGGVGVALDFIGAKREYYLSELFDHSTKSHDYFDDQIMELDTTFNKELVFQSECTTMGQFPYAEDLAMTGDFEIFIQQSGESPLNSLKVVLWEDSSRCVLNYYKSEPRILLRELLDFDSYLSYEVPNDNSFPNSNSTFIIRRVDNVYSFFIDKKYLFHHFHDNGKLNEVGVFIGETCAITSIYKLTK